MRHRTVARPKVEWHAFCCGGRVTPKVFPSKHEAEAYLELYACVPDVGRVVRVEVPRGCAS